MCLSYSALAEPASTETAMKRMPLLVEKRIPSLRLDRLSRYSAMMARMLPAHCQPFSRSPKRSMENASTKTGRVALIVEAVVSGSSLMP